MPELMVAAQELDNGGDGVPNYQRGDVIAVMPDGHVWGKREGAPRYVHLHVDGDLMELRLLYTEHDYDWEDEPRDPEDPNSRPIKRVKKKWNRRTRGISNAIMQSAEAQNHTGKVLSVLQRVLERSTINRRKKDGRERKFPRDYRNP